MSLIYLDTSALMRRAERAVPVPSTRNIATEAIVAGLIADPANEIACSEVGLLEFHSCLNTNLRGDTAAWDFDWYNAARSLLLGEIASGRIIVLPTPPRAFEHAMAMVSDASSRLRRAFHSWDAAHVAIAAAWAYQRGEPVDILTSDADFQVALELSDFGGRVRVVNLDVAAGTGNSLDRRTARS